MNGDPRDDYPELAWLARRAACSSRCRHVACQRHREAKAVLDEVAALRKLKGEAHYPPRGAGKESPS